MRSSEESNRRLEHISSELISHLRIFDKYRRFKSSVHGSNIFLTSRELAEPADVAWRHCCDVLVQMKEKDEPIHDRTHLDVMSTFVRIETGYETKFFPISSALSTVMGPISKRAHRSRDQEMVVHVVPMHILRMMCMGMQSSSGSYCDPSVSDILKMTSGVGVVSFTPVDPTKAGHTEVSAGSLAVISKTGFGEAKLESMCCPLNRDMFMYGIGVVLKRMGISLLSTPEGKTGVEMLATSRSDKVRVVFDLENRNQGGNWNAYEKQMSHAAYKVLLDKRKHRPTSGRRS